MRHRTIIAALAVIGAALPAAPAAAADKEKKPSAERMICKRQSNDTGSRLNTKRVCATHRQWAELEAITQETRRNIEKVQRERAH